MYKTNKFDFYSTAVNTVCYFLWIFILFFNPCTRIVPYHIIHASYFEHTIILHLPPPPQLPLDLPGYVSYLLLVVPFLSNIDIQKPYIFVFESMAQVPL